MVKHQKCDGVAEVDAFINGSGLSLSQVQIVSVAGKFGSHYMVFYEPRDEGTPDVGE